MTDIEIEAHEDKKNWCVTDVPRLSEYLLRTELEAQVVHKIRLRTEKENRASREPRPEPEPKKREQSGTLSEYRPRYFTLGDIVALCSAIYVSSALYGLYRLILGS